jgi:hypothetical protein
VWLLGKARLWENNNEEKVYIARHRSVDLSLSDITGNHVLDRIVAYSTLMDFFTVFTTRLVTGVVVYTLTVYSSV